MVPKTLQDDREPASGKVSENKRTTQRYWQGFDYPGGLAADNLGDEAFDGLIAIELAVPEPSLHGVSEAYVCRQFLINAYCGY